MKLEKQTLIKAGRTSVTTFKTTLDALTRLKDKSGSTAQLWRRKPERTTTNLRSTKKLGIKSGSL